MPKFIVELELDGYDTEEDEERACLVFIEEQLDFSGSYIKVKKYDPKLDKYKQTK